MNFDELLLKRYSCRNYIDKEVDLEDIKKIINAGRISPSARNSQPCEYYIVRDEENVRKLRIELQKPGFNKFVPNVSSFIALVITEEMYNTMLSGLKRDFTDIDTGIAVHAMALEATNLGLATCILGGFDYDGVASVIGIKEPNRIRLVLAVGYSNDEKIQDKNLRRKGMEEVVKYF
jgi:nitroreductase